MLSNNSFTKLKSARGGRGKKAPYQTTHVRIPCEIEEYVYFLSNKYKEAIEQGKEQSFLTKLNNIFALLSKED
jgi:hypothetical protein